MSLDQVIAAMIEADELWRIPFFDFVDSFRRGDIDLSGPGPSMNHPRYAALIAATIDFLTDEAGFDKPAWLQDIPPLAEPWLVCGIELLRPLILKKCPARFKKRNILVLDNFLFRV